ncbi:hypothetical protein ATKI12_4442 [Kitasatospora sp. Ki12]
MSRLRDNPCDPQLKGARTGRRTPGQRCSGSSVSRSIQATVPSVLGDGPR